MSIEEDVFTALTSGSPVLRAYPDVLPQMAVIPAVTFFTVGGDNDFHLQGQSGLVRRVIQIDTWASTRLSADAMMKEVEALMVASTDFQVNAIFVAGVDPYEPDTNRYRTGREFVLWAQQ